jgi:isochorismate hydrolase
MSYNPFTPELERCSLVILDIQEKLIPAMPAEVVSNVVRNNQILLAAADQFQLPVVITEQNPRGLGLTVPTLKIALPENTPLIEKSVFSAWQNPSFEKALRQTRRDDVILTGIEAHVCVLQTALDLLANDFRVFIPADAVCSRSKLNWRLGLDLLRQAGAIITTTEIATFQLLKTAGTPEFKALSRLIK